MAILDFVVILAMMISHRPAPLHAPWCRTRWAELWSFLCVFLRLNSPVLKSLKTTPDADLLNSSLTSWQQTACHHTIKSLCTPRRPCFGPTPAFELGTFAVVIYFNLNVDDAHVSQVLRDHVAQIDVLTCGQRLLALSPPMISGSFGSASKHICKRFWLWSIYNNVFTKHHCGLRLIIVRWTIRMSSIHSFRV